MYIKNLGFGQHILAVSLSMDILIIIEYSQLLKICPD